MSVISKKNQITIPAEALRAAALGPGDDVRIVATGTGRLEMVRAEELIEELAGVVGAETYPKGYLEELRREWE